MVKHAGAKVIAITTRAGQADVLREHGADEVIVAPDLQFARQVKSLTAGVGADLVLEVAGEPTLAQSLHAVRTGGRVVVIGNVSGKPSEVRIAHLVMKEIALLGTKSCSNEELTEVMRLVAEGELSVDISRVIPLDEVRDAHVDMEEQRSSGRIVLTVGGDPEPTRRRAHREAARRHPGRIRSSRLWPRPFATRHLADLGAEIIKVERPDGGDFARASTMRRSAVVSQPTSRG